jgi:hypothetical protein
MKTIPTTEPESDGRLATKADAMIAELKTHMNERGLYNKKAVPVAFRYLFKHHLKDLLLDVYVWCPDKGWEWKFALNLLDKLIWSLTPPEGKQEREKIIAAIPGILRGFRMLEKKAGVSQDRIEALLADLEFHHKRILRFSPYPNIDEELQQTIAKPRMAGIPKDPELAKSIVEIKSHLPDVDDVTINTLLFEIDASESRQGANTKKRLFKFSNIWPARHAQQDWNLELDPSSAIG